MSKGLKITTFILSILMVFVGWFIALKIAGGMVSGWSEDFKIKSDKYVEEAMSKAVDEMLDSEENVDVDKYIQQSIESTLADEEISKGLKKNVMMIIILLAIAGIIPSLILKFTGQPKKAIVTIILAGGLDVMTSQIWRGMQIPGLDLSTIFSKFANAAIAGFVIALVITIVLNFILKSNTQEVTEI